MKSMVLVFISFGSVLCGSYEDNIRFIVFKNSERSSLFPNHTLADKGCKTSEKLAVITHGWRESIHVTWVADMVGNLTEKRGGCIIFIDYSFYGNISNYFRFLSHFKKISALMTKKFVKLESEGFKPADWFMFGHSAGARLVIDSAANFGYQKVKEIDGKSLKFKKVPKTNPYSSLRASRTRL